MASVMDSTVALYLTLAHMRSDAGQSKLLVLTLNSWDPWPPAVREPKVPLNT